VNVKLGASLTTAAHSLSYSCLRRAKQALAALPMSDSRKVKGLVNLVNPVISNAFQ